MPTGYTSIITDGATFEQFLLGCARAFGALISMRDDPHDAEIPDEFKPNTHHIDALLESKTKLEHIKNTTLEEAAVKAKEEFQAVIKSHEESITRQVALRNKYNSMLSQVRAWIPPTADHQGLKDFMVQQIEDSIKWDCSSMEDYYRNSIPKLLTPEEWLNEQVSYYMRDIAYHEKENSEEIRRCKERTEWVRDLRNSVKSLRSE